MPTTKLHRTTVKFSPPQYPCGPRYVPNAALSTPPAVPPRLRSATVTRAILISRTKIRRCCRSDWTESRSECIDLITWTTHNFIQGIRSSSKESGYFWDALLLSPKCLGISPSEFRKNPTGYSMFEGDKVKKL